MATESAIIDAEPVSLAELFKTRPRRRIGGLKRSMLATVDVGVTMPNDQPFELTAVDTAAMTVGPVVISTIGIDRYEDVIRPHGIDFEQYKANPIVMLDHGEHYHLPIAKSMDGDGNLLVDVYDDRVEASAIFSRSTPEAYQTFGLISEGILRGTSIHLVPVEAYRRSEGTSAGGRPGYDVTKSTMLEWSFGGIPVNADCVAKTLGANRIGGDILLPAIRKTLEAHAPERRRTGRGFDKSFANLKGYDMALLPRSLKKSVTGKASDDPEKRGEGDAQDANDQGDDNDGRPYGQKVTEAAHDGARNLADNLENCMSKLEHPDVKAKVGEWSEGLRGIQKDMAECHKKSYPDADPLEKDEDESEDDSDDDESMAKFMAGGTLRRLRVGGLAHTLRGLGLAKNITAHQRNLLEKAACSLEGVITKSKEVEVAQADPTEAAVVAAVDAKFDGMKKSMSDFREQLLSMIPANKRGA